MLIKEVEKEASRKGLNMLFKTINDNTEEINFMGKAKDIAGLIIAGNITPKNLRTIKKTRIPFVLIGDVLQKTKTNESVDVIASDDFQGMYVATKHLIDLGHRGIIYLASVFSKKFPWQVECFDGYKAALKDSKIAYDRDLLVQLKDIDYEGGYKAMREFLEKSFPFTAMVGNIFGKEFFGAIKALSQKNITVPEDVSVILFDDLPGITNIDNDLAAIGRTAFERLMQRLTDPGWKPERVIVPGKLHISVSTRPLEAAVSGQKIQKRQLSYVG